MLFGMANQGGCWKIGCGGLVGAAFLFLLTAYLIGGSKATDRASADPRIDFIVECKSAVRDKLKAPDSAQFGPETAFDVQGSPGNYRLTGTIEAKNSFGVMLKTAYTCTGSAQNVDVGIY